MIAACTMRNCGAIIRGPGGPTPADEYKALAAELTLHLAKDHRDVFIAINLAAANFCAGLASKLFDSTDPSFQHEQQESFKLNYWLLAGALRTSKSAGALEKPGLDPGSAPAIRLTST